MKLILFIAASAAALFAQTQGEILSQDQYITGATAQSALGNNILLDTAGTGATDTMVPGRSQYRSVHVHIVASAGISVGQVIFEHSLNNVTFFPVQAWEVTTAANVTATAAVNAAFAVAANANRMFVFKVIGRYVRCRISTGFTGGTVQAFSRLSIADHAPVVTTLSTATQTITGTVSATVSQSTAAVTPTTDVASGAITTTATSGAISMVTTGSSTGSSFSVNVTLVSGTNPTLDVRVECSLNTTTWFTIYEFERVTAAANLHSPTIAVPCQQVRYVRTISGTTPSFTMSITRLTRSVEGIAAYQYFNRTIDPETLDSATSAYWVQGATIISVYVSSAAATTAASVVLEVSTDGASWAVVGSPVASVASKTVSFTNTVAAKWARLRIDTPGSGQTFNYVAIATGR